MRTGNFFANAVLGEFDGAATLDAVAFEEFGFGLHREGLFSDTGDGMAAASEAGEAAFGGSHESADDGARQCAARVKAAGALADAMGAAGAAYEFNPGRLKKDRAMLAMGAGNFFANAVVGGKFDGAATLGAVTFEEFGFFGVHKVGLFSDRNVK